MTFNQMLTMVNTGGEKSQAVMNLFSFPFLFSVYSIVYQSVLSYNFTRQWIGSNCAFLLLPHILLYSLSLAT